MSSFNRKPSDSAELNLLSAQDIKKGLQKIILAAGYSSKEFLLSHGRKNYLLTLMVANQTQIIANIGRQDTRNSASGNQGIRD